MKQFMQMIGNNFILDTCFIIDVFENKINAIDFQKEKSIYISSVCIGELYYGAYLSKLTSKNIIKINDFISSFPSFNIDEHTGVFYGKIKSELKKNGTPIPENDIWIAAVTIQNDCTLVTNDKHFNLIPNLSILSY